MEPGQQRSRGDGSDVVARVNNTINNDFERIVASSFFCFFNTSLETTYLLVSLLVVIRDVELETCS
jgi:hypothetical protein